MWSGTRGPAGRLLELAWASFPSSGPSDATALGSEFGVFLFLPVLCESLYEICIIQL